MQMADTSGSADDRGPEVATDDALATEHDQSAAASTGQVSDDTAARRRVTLASARQLLAGVEACTEVDPDAAETMAQQARVLARSAVDTGAEAEAVLRQAVLAQRARRVDQAFAAALEARELAVRGGAPAVEVEAVHLLARIHMEAGNFSDALDAALQSLERHRITDVGSSEGPLLTTVADIHQALGDLDRAIATYDAAMAANAGSGRDDLDVGPLASLARARATRREHLLAINAGEAALEVARRHQPAAVARILAQLSASYCAMNAPEQAAACLSEAELIALDGLGAAEAASSHCTLALARGDLDRMAERPSAAAEQYRQALALALEHGMVDQELRAHTALAAVYKQLGRFEEALAHQEARFDRHQDLFSHGADLRVKTLQIAHDTEATRQQAEILRLRTGELEELVRGRTYDLEEYQLEAFERLAVIAEFRDTDTGEHTVRVGDMAALLARELGESVEFSQQLRLAGRLHDIGKVAVPDAILLKPGPLTAAEFEVMKTHTTVGAEILSGSTSPLIQLAAEVALNHHERWDGTGYPSGLLGESIPMSGRIVAVADVFDALISERPYKRAWSRAEAVHYITAGSGSHFEPRIVEAFLRVIGRSDPELGPVGPDDELVETESRLVTVPVERAPVVGDPADRLGMLVAELARSAARAEQAVVRLEQPVIWADEPVVWGGPDVEQLAEAEQVVEVSHHAAPLEVTGSVEASPAVEAAPPVEAVEAVEAAPPVEAVEAADAPDQPDEPAAAEAPVEVHKRGQRRGQATGEPPVITPASAPRKRSAGTSGDPGQRRKQVRRGGITRTEVVEMISLYRDIPPDER
jgi:putative two-component system response regulator